MNYSITIHLKGLPDTMNARKHWRAVHSHRKIWKKMVAEAVKGREPKTPLKKAIIVVTRYSSRACDYDNLVSSGKALIDGLTEAGIIEDDSLDHIGIPIFKWEKTKPKEGRVSVAVYDLNHALARFTCPCSCSCSFHEEVSEGTGVLEGQEPLI